MQNNDWGKNCLYKTIVAVGTFLCIFLIVVSIQGLKSLSVHNDPAMSTINVPGKGEVVAIPDIATFNFSVTESAKTISDAQNLATDKFNKALDAVQALGVEKKDVKTISYNISPKYESQTIYCIAYPCIRPSPKVTGYEVSQTVEIKVRDLSKVGELFQKVGDINIGNVSGLVFSVEDRDTIKDEARAKALTDARERADSIARALGVRIVRVVSYYDNNNEFYPATYSAKSMMADVAVARPAPELPAGEQKITSEVNVTYEIR